MQSLDRKGSPTIYSCRHLTMSSPQTVSCSRNPDSVPHAPHKGQESEAQGVSTVCLHCGEGKSSRGKEALATGNWACPALWTHSPDPQSHLTQGHPSVSTVDSVQVQPSTVWKCGRPFVAHEAFNNLNHLRKCCLTHRYNHLEHRRIVRLCEQLTWGQGFLDGASGKEPICQCRKHKRRRFNP